MKQIVFENDIHYFLVIFRIGRMRQDQEINHLLILWTEAVMLHQNLVITKIGIGKESVNREEERATETGNVIVERTAEKTVIDLDINCLFSMYL